MKGHKEKVQDGSAEVLQNVLSCSSTTAKPLNKCRSIGDRNILLHSLKQGRRDLEKKQHAKRNKQKPTLELQKLLLSNTDLQYKISYLYGSQKVSEIKMLALTVQ